jgi:hypothetical protein
MMNRQSTRHAKHAEPLTQGMHKMHREYKNVEKKKRWVVAVVRDASVKKEVECSS